MFDEFQLERFCEHNPDCGCNCMRCPAFAKHYRDENGFDDDDDDEDETEWYDY